MTTSSTVKRRRSSTSNTPSDGESDTIVGNSNMESGDSPVEHWTSTGYEYINPFVHRLQFNSSIDIAKIYVLTVLLLPIRIVGCVVSLLSAWLFASIGLYGLNKEDLQERPLTGWRKKVQSIACGCMRMVYASGSFHYITFKGEPAPAKKAPILVVAPHSSYVDSIIVVANGPHSIVAKQETSKIPILGKIINFAQPIFVQREDPNSRQNTIREIVRRARSEDPWSQVVIFAEGTCTNRSALIKFKPGAFYPGVPVQPVIIKYPNRHDTFTWTWNGPGVWRLIWMTMSQFYCRCEIEFLSVYEPNDDEKNDANLYAKNVRNVMARALSVPTSEYSFEDVIMMSRAKDMQIPFPGDIIEIERILYILNLLDSSRDTDLLDEYFGIPNRAKLNFNSFAKLLKVNIKNTYLRNLFSLLDNHRKGRVSLKSFLLCYLYCKYKNEELINFLKTITKMYAESSESISRVEFCKILNHSGKMTEAKSNALFLQIDHLNKGYITYDDFRNHTQDLPKYKFLYKKLEFIRRDFKTK